jgi:hypothetical protein
MTAGLGVIYGSRLVSISTGFHGDTIVACMVATAVIGGASPFGRRGRAEFSGVVISRRRREGAR